MNWPTLGMNHRSPRNEVRLCPILGNGGIGKMVSFAIPDENDPTIPTPTHRKPAPQCIRRHVTPFSPMVATNLAMEDDENDHNNGCHINAVEHDCTCEDGGNEVENEAIIRRRQGLFPSIQKRSAERARLLNAQLAAAEVTTISAGTGDEKEKELYPD